MVATIHQLIGKINPKLYAENGKELLGKYGSSENIPAEEVKPKPIDEHSLVYDSSSETLEPIYFYILDLMNDFGLDPEKYTDTFTSSPGSGHFSELGTKATAMQQQGTKILGDINTVMRSILNIIYDLREFKIRLESYNDLKSENKNRAQAAVLSLKQIWMDKVDINKGNSSIKAMALGQAGFQTLIDAFLVARNLDDADKLDLNDRVKRIVKARIVEFGDWLENSGKELQKRYQIEKTYLKSQVNSMKLYARWAKPYLRAAAQLEMKEHGREPALVKAFNTLLLELTLLGKTKLKIQELALEGKLPSEFKRLQQKRDYFGCVLVDFRFRGIPQKVGQHYVFGGRSDISFSSYALNKDEIDKLNEEVEKSDIGDVFGLIEGITTESLEQLKDDIEFFLNEDDSDHSHRHEGKDMSNPFVALMGGYNEKEEVPHKHIQNKEEKKKIIRVAPDTWIEKTHLRKLAEEAAEEMAFKVFDIYKKSHGMPSYT